MNDRDLAALEAVVDKIFDPKKARRMIIVDNIAAGFCACILIAIVFGSLIDILF